MQSAENGKHYGPPLTGWQGALAARMRAKGFDTVGEHTYASMVAAGLEPRDLVAAPHPSADDLVGVESLTDEPLTDEPLV